MAKRSRTKQYKGTKATYHLEHNLNNIEGIECIKLPNSVYVILDDLGEIENIFYDKKKADKHCEFRNNIAPMSSYIVEKFCVYDADEEGEE